MKRSFLSIAGFILVIGAYMHASAFPKISSAVAASNLAPFAGNSLKVLWLADSATAFLLGVLFAIAIVKPHVIKRAAILILALIPGTVAVLIYIFVGNFIGGHIMLAAALMTLAAGLVGQENV